MSLSLRLDHVAIRSDHVAIRSDHVAEPSVDSTRPPVAEPVGALRDHGPEVARRAHDNIVLV